MDRCSAAAIDDTAWVYRGYTMEEHPSGLIRVVHPTGPVGFWNLSVAQIHAMIDGWLNAV